MRYFDLGTKEHTSTDNVFSTAFGKSCQRLKVTPNEGYDPNLEATLFIPEDSDNFGLEAIAESNKARKILRDNDLKFEDDVITYMVLLCGEIIKPEILAHSTKLFEPHPFDLQDKIKNLQTLERIMIYVSNAETRFMQLAIGNYSEKIEEETKTLYSFGANLQQEKFGRDDQKGLVLEKMSRRLNRYIPIAREMFGEVLYNNGPKSNSLGIDKKTTVDELLEQLNSAESEEDKTRIIQRLKDVSQIKDDLF